MKRKLLCVLLMLLVVFGGCNAEDKKQDLTKVELSSDDVVMGVMCMYQYSNDIYGTIDVLLVYADGRICVGTCPKDVGIIYSEFLGKVRGSDITVWSVLEDVEEVACLSAEEMKILTDYTQSIDMEREKENRASEKTKSEPEPEPAVEDIFNSYSYFCYQWNEDHIPTYFPIKWSGGKAMDENALAALDLLLQNEYYKSWYDNCQQITWDATQIWD